MFRQLAFASRARAGLRAAETSSLMAVSRSKNACDSVTGVLLYTGERFLAIVEGREATIAALWPRIERDDRHREIVTLFDRATDARRFSRWQAGYVSERALAADLDRWCGSLPLETGEIERILARVEGAETF